jgi:hypothetical protein
VYFANGQTDRTLVPYKVESGTRITGLMRLECTDNLIFDPVNQSVLQWTGKDRKKRQAFDCVVRAEARAFTFLCLCIIATINYIKVPLFQMYAYILIAGNDTFFTITSNGDYLDSGQSLKILTWQFASMSSS